MVPPTPEGSKGEPGIPWHVQDFATFQLRPVAFRTLRLAEGIPTLDPTKNGLNRTVRNWQTKRKTEKRPWEKRGKAVWQALKIVIKNWKDDDFSSKIWGPRKWLIFKGKMWVFREGKLRLVASPKKNCFQISWYLANILSWYIHRHKSTIKSPGPFTDGLKARTFVFCSFNMTCLFPSIRTLLTGKSKTSFSNRNKNTTGNLPRSSEVAKLIRFGSKFPTDQVRCTWIVMSACRHVTEFTILGYMYIYIYTLGAWGSPGTPAPRGFIYMKLGWGWGGVGVGWGGDGNVPCTCTHGRCYATSCSLHLHTWSVLRKSWDWGGVRWGW